MGRFITSLVIILGSLNSHAQLVQSGDFNNDGYLDSIFYAKNCQLCSYDFVIFDGSTNDKDTLWIDGCKCATYETLLIPPKFHTVSNKGYIHGIANMLPHLNDSPDPALNWMLSGKKNNWIVVDNVYFNKIIAPKDDWRAGPPIVPHEYSVFLENDELDLAYSSFGEKPDFFKNKSKKGFLIFNGLSQSNGSINSGGSFKEIVKSEDYSINAVDHGIIAVADGFYKWLFVTDYHLTGAPDKMRWPSIHEVVIYKGYIILRQGVITGVREALFLIDIETGFVGRLMYSSFSGSSMILENDQLTFKSQEPTYPKSEPINLKNLLAAFEKLKFTYAKIPSKI